VYHLFARGLRVTLLRYYLGINQLLIRGSPKKKFAVKRKRFGPLQTFFRQWERDSDADARTFVSIYQDFTVFLHGKKGVKQCGQGWRRINV